MTPAEQRKLAKIAEELLADRRLAALVQLFTEPAPPRSPVRRRMVRPLLAVAALLLTGAAIALLVSAQLTRTPVFLVGLVLVVPVFWLFGRSWHGPERPGLSPA